MHKEEQKFNEDTTQMIQHFLEHFKDERETGMITTMKAIIAQFITIVTKKMVNQPEFVGLQDALQIQIDSLITCIVHFEQCKSITQTGMTLQ